MNKAIFDRLTTDQKYSVISNYHSLLANVVSNRMSLLPFASGLAISLLVIATFNPELFPLDNTVKWIMTMLLIIAPTALHFYNNDLITAQREIRRNINNLLAIQTPEINLGIQNKITRFIPDFFIAILSIISIILIVKIWN